MMIRTPTTLGPEKNDDGWIWLPHWFEPSDKDVICGRAKQYHHHPGNQRFRRLVELSAPLYDATDNKLGRTKVIASIIQRIRRETEGKGGFVKRNAVTGSWYEIGDDKARDKVGHAIRRVIEEKKKKNTWSALVKEVASATSDRVPSETTQEHSGPGKHQDGDDSSDAKPPSLRSRSEILRTHTKMELFQLQDTTSPDAAADSAKRGVIDKKEKKNKLPSASDDTIKFPGAPSKPHKAETLPLLDTLHAIATLQQQQVNLQSNNISSLGLANLGVPPLLSSFPVTSLHQNGLMQNYMNNQSIPSTPSIAERIVDTPHQWLGQCFEHSNGASSNNKTMQTSDFGSLSRMLPASNNLGFPTLQNRMSTKPMGMPASTATLQPAGSDGTTSLFPGTYNAATEQLLASLNPTPIGPNATVVSRDTDKTSISTETEKGSPTNNGLH